MSRWAPPQAFGEPEPVHFGFRLRPLALGHLALLADIGVEFDGGIDSSILTAFVCSVSHTDASANLRAWWSKPLLRWVAYRAGKRLRMEQELAAFKAWLEFQLSGPSAKYRTAPKATTTPRGSIAAPLHLNLLAGALATLHLTEAAALAMPVKRIRQLLCAHHESEGRIELWTEQEYAFEEMCKQADARRAMKPEPARN